MPSNVNIFNTFQTENVFFDVVHQLNICVFTHAMHTVVAVASVNAFTKLNALENDRKIE